jgi:putative endonuclease
LSEQGESKGYSLPLSPLSKSASLRTKLESLLVPAGWCVYLLICIDGSYYVGISDNLSQRILDHAQGKGSSHTKENQPVIFAWYETHANREAAQVRERQLKGWSRAKKNHLARGDFPAFRFGHRPHIHLA